MFCVNCGNEVDSSWNFCPFCSSALKGNVKSVNNEKKEFEIWDGVLTKYNGEAREVWIPSGVTDIAEKAFYQKKYLEIVHIPEGVKTIGISAFKYANNLNMVFFPNSLHEIGISAFRYTRLNNVQLPKNLTVIGDEAFDGTNLKEIIIPESVTEIGERAFDTVETIEFKEDPSKISMNGCCGYVYSTKWDSEFENLKKIIVPDYWERSNSVTRFINSGNLVFKVEQTYRCSRCGGLMVYTETGIFSSVYKCPVCGVVKKK